MEVTLKGVENDYSWMDEQIQLELLEKEVNEKEIEKHKLVSSTELVDEQNTLDRQIQKENESNAIKERESRRRKTREMKMREKYSRRDNGASNVRYKPGACISAKQWARMDDVAREKAVKSGALPPYKVEKLKRKRNQAMQPP